MFLLLSMFEHRVSQSFKFKMIILQCYVSCACVVMTAFVDNFSLSARQQTTKTV